MKSILFTAWVQQKSDRRLWSHLFRVKMGRCIGGAAQLLDLRPWKIPQRWSYGKWLSLIQEGVLNQDQEVPKMSLWSVTRRWENWKTQKKIIWVSPGFDCSSRLHREAWRKDFEANSWIHWIPGTWLVYKLGYEPVMNGRFSQIRKGQIQHLVSPPVQNGKAWVCLKCGLLYHQFQHIRESCSRKWS